jgi:hypothetical protein
MTITTICQECNTPNPPGGKFCSNCGARLPKNTRLLCPRCQTPNPTSNFYCDTCGARLVQEEAPPPSEAAAKEDLPTSAKMFSLPTRKPGQTGELNADNVMDWLKAGQVTDSSEPQSPKTDTGKLPRLSDLTPEQRAKTDDLPAWLVDSDSQESIIQAPQDITTEHFLNMIKQIDDEERKKLTGMLSDPALTGKGGKLPDWLQEFTRSAEEKPAPPTPTPVPPRAKPSAPPQKAEEADDLDWLSELGPLDTDVLAQPIETLTSGPARGQKSGDLPDWLDELEPPNTEMLSRPSSLPDVPSVDAILSGQDVPDWLTGGDVLEEETSGTDRLSLPATGLPAEAAFEPEEDYPNWLVSPPDTSELELPHRPQPIEEFSAASQKSVTDWLTGFDEDEDEDDEEEESAEDTWDDLPEATAVPLLADDKARKSLTDWLTQLDAGAPQPAESFDESELVEASLSDWFGDSAEMETAVAASPTLDDEEDLDDWLITEEPDTAEQNRRTGKTGPLPDWLDELEPTDTLPAEAQQSFVSGMLDDLLGPAIAAEAFADEQPAAEEPLPFEEVEEMSSGLHTMDLDEEPDWLSELAAFDPNDLVERENLADQESWLTQETAVSHALPDIEETFAGSFDFAELPDAGQMDQAAPDEEWGSLDDILAESDDAGELADWLEQLAVPAAASLESPSLPSTEESAETLISTGDLPEWIASMRPEDTDKLGSQSSLLPSVLPNAEDDLYAIAGDLADADLPDWLQDTAVSAPDKTAVTLASAELPVWVDTESDLGEPSSELASILAGLPPALPPEEMLQKAEIPDWIQDLKPTELTGRPSFSTDFKLQTTGPLAGMPGVVKVEPIVAMPRTVDPIVQFTVTPEQQQQARLLRQLVQEEQQPAQVDVGSSKATGRRGLRFLLACLLLAALALALFMPNLLIGSQPMPVPPAAAALHTAVNAAAGQPVLVAFEYTPALAGELNHEARLLLSQLQDNGSQILITSQSAAGTAVAATLTESLAEPPIAIGMLAGEAIGLRQLGNCIGNPEFICSTLQGRGLSSETQTALQNVGLIVVLTGEQTNLINWIEQVGSATDTPLVAGVTQSLSPVAAPYYASGQLQGHLDGLPATIALANNVGSSADMTQAQSQYNAQSLVQLAAALLLVVGALMMATTRKKSSAQGQ